MIACRLCRRTVGLLVLVAAALGPMNARAGIQTWGAPVCTEPVAVSLLFTSSFSALDKCESLCKLAANRCRQAVNDAASCKRRNRTDFSKALELAFCAPLKGAEKRMCVSPIRADLKLSNESLTADRTLALANCGVYRSQCLVDCTTL